jgi:uncharacterized protein YukE
MSFDGMDLDQAQDLARQLEGHAQTLAHVTASLTALTAALSQSWHGPAAAVFQQQWAAQHHPALNGATRVMEDLRGHLVANIQQQVRASAADSGPGGAWGAVAGLTAVLGTASAAWDRYVDRFTTPLELVKELAGNDWVTGRYDKTWTRLMNLDRDSSLLKYKQSPVLHALHDNELVQRAGRVLTETHAGSVLESLGTVGTVMGWAAVGSDAGQAAIALHDHQYASAGGDLVDATADGLKNKGLVGYLAGADLTLLKEDYDLGSQIDWKQGIPDPFDGDTFREDYLPTFKSLPGQMVGPLEKAFL